MENTLIYIYKCPECDIDFSSIEQLRYCDDGECQDKNIELKLITTVEEGKTLSWSNGVEWGEIDHPVLGSIMTYWKEGTPCYDTYTAPMVDNEGDIYCYRYDHDEGHWKEEMYILGLYTGIDTCKFS